MLIDRAGNEVSEKIASKEFCHKNNTRYSIDMTKEGIEIIIANIWKN